ncbi:MAG: hypothetical protein J5504_05335 [Butyrivibrio sp.]|nr:hypothetical protein [Butyrivibrio sp.]
MSKKSVIVAALCMAAGMVTGCTSYSEDSSAGTEGTSDAAIEASSEKSVNSAAYGISLDAADEASTVASTAASSDSASDKKSATDKSADAKKDKENDKDKKASDDKSKDKSKAKKGSKNGIPEVPEVKDGVTKITDRGVEAYFEWEPAEGGDRYEIICEGKPRGSSNYTKLEEMYTNMPNYSYGAGLNYDVRIKVRAYNGNVQDGLCSEWSEYVEGNTYEDSLATPVVKDGVKRTSAGGTEVYFAWEAVKEADHYEVVVEHKKSDKSEYEIKEVTYTNAPNYTYSAQGDYDVRITVKAQTNAWINGKKKVFSSQASSYAKGKTY